MLLGFETSDDAALYKLNDDLLAVLTVDFFTPVVDDPYEFGRIAGANALSDIFAMGAQPLVALNLLALDCNLGTGVASEILRGGADAVREAGAHIVGGHTIDDPEPKYGLAVFGTALPDKVIRNKGAQPGDLLYLTKPLGTGILSAAFNIGAESDASMRPAIESMMELNAFGSKAMRAADAHAATDVTGFGLMGHLHEMLEASECSAVLDWDSIPLFDGVWDYSCEYCRPGRTFSIMDFVEEYVDQSGLEDEEFDNRMGVLCDPQTSGGLLVSVSPDKAQIFEDTFRDLTERDASRIGTIQEGKAGTISFS